MKIQVTVPRPLVLAKDVPNKSFCVIASKPNTGRLVFRFGNKLITMDDWNGKGMLGDTFDLDVCGNSLFVLPCVKGSVIKMMI
jgi:hypothetical protein